MSSKNEVTVEFFRDRSVTDLDCKKWVEERYGASKPADIQGQQSYTVITSNKAVQFRTEELDMAICSQARQIYGDLVPNFSCYEPFGDLSVYIADKINGPSYMAWIMTSEERRGNENVVVDLAK